MASVKIFRLFAAVAVLLTALAGSAHAAPRANGYPITNVNLRAGPGTDYPVIVTVPSRAPISIRGCLPDHTWCDVTFEQNRGWMAAVYLAGWSGGQYYLLRDYAPELRYPVVSFEIDNYWGSNYRDRPFYGERTRWTRPRDEGWVDNGIFYNRLAPYGRWVWLQGQYVWVPTRVDGQWRPYTYGRWVYTERYGWMWASDEPWGWATYHYGRWGFSNRIGWFWVPGNRWGPAWVSWRSSGDYLAWAPLPPVYGGGLSVEVSIGTVPDYYWQVVPAGAFLSVNLSQAIVRDRARIRPLIQRSRPLGHVTVEKNVVVNKVVNVKYVEEKTKKKVVVHEVARTKDAAKAGKVEGDAVEVFEPVADQESAVAVPPEPKKIEEVAAESQTKEQAGGEPSTEELLAPPEVTKATKDERKPKAPPEPVAAEDGEAAPADEAAPPPPPAGDEQKPATGDEAAPSPPPVPDAGVAPKPAEKPKPAKPEDDAPPAAEEPEKAEPAPVEPPAAPPTQEEAPPPASEEAAPPSAEEQTAAPEEPTPAAPPAATPDAPKPKKDGGPKDKKGKGKGKDSQKRPGAKPESAAPPPPPAEDTAPPAPAEEDAAPAAPPPPPAEETSAPKAKKDGKPKNNKPGKPAAADDTPQDGKGKKKGKKGSKPAQDGSCPEGTALLDDGSCVPAE